MRPKKIPAGISRVRPQPLAWKWTLAAMAADSVSLESEAKRAAKLQTSGVSWQQAILLFFIFLLVVSDYFVSNVVYLVPKSVRGREVTTNGAVVQAICLVLLYALGVHLCNEHIL